MFYYTRRDTSRKKYLLIKPTIPIIKIIYEKFNFNTFGTLYNYINEIRLPPRLNDQ